ncbi:MAG: TIGR00730 family Rossman fold protein, partial [Planctomycetota bacterium]
MNAGPQPARPFRVTVYASSSERVDAGYHAIAEELGARIAERGWELVWGGGRHGLMGALSRGARARGGRTLGVILQQFIDKNVHCDAAHEMATVHDMRLRKRGLDEGGDAFIALPGGLGTLDELLEMLSFKQLGFHRKPIVILNANDYWRPLLDMLERGLQQGFIQQHYRGLWSVASTPAAAIDQIVHGQPWPAPAPDPR